MKFKIEFIAKKHPFKRCSACTETILNATIENTAYILEQLKMFFNHNMYVVITTNEYAKKHNVISNTKSAYIVFEHCEYDDSCSEFLRDAEIYAKQKGCDVIFGIIPNRPKFPRKPNDFISDVDLAKQYLHERGFAVNGDDNYFHKPL